MKSIITETVQGDSYFTCHKTLNLPEDEQSLCAGKIIFEGKVNRGGNSSTRMAHVLLGFEGYDSMEGQDIVFNTIDECINHHT